MTMSNYPDRYVITALIAEVADRGNTVWDKKKGERVWLYWTEESGGWWQWGPEEWAYRFESLDSPKIQEALRSCPTMGPWYNSPDPKSIKTVPVPAIVKVY